MDWKAMRDRCAKAYVGDGSTEYIYVAVMGKKIPNDTELWEDAEDVLAKVRDALDAAYEDGRRETIKESNRLHAGDMRAIEKLRKGCEHRGQTIKRLNDKLEQRRKQVRELYERKPKMQLPEGVEWPRYEDGELVGLGDEYASNNGNTYYANRISFSKTYTGDIVYFFNNEHFHKMVERVKRPAPPDSWERLEAECGDEKSLDILRRAKALAGIE